MEPAETRYLQRDGGALAYQVVGDGGADVVWLSEINQHLDMAWTEPQMHQLYSRAAQYSRTVYFQQRGIGLSDPTPAHPTVEEQADDALAVMDAIGMERATLVASFTTAGPAALVAARAPGRVHGLVLISPLVQGLATAVDGVPDGWTRAEMEEFVALWTEVFATWGSGRSAAVSHPSFDTSYNRRLFALLERSSASPARAEAFFKWAVAADARSVLPQVKAPARVLHTPGGTIPEGHVREVAQLLPNATFHELPLPPLGSSIGEYFVPVYEQIATVATGAAPDRVDVRMGAVVFTDLVASTELLARLGDTAYGELRSAHERRVRVAVDRFGGELQSVTGDGTLSLFASTARALEGALAVVSEEQEHGLSMRVGVHTGEVDQTHLSPTGMTVHVAARLMALAGAGQVLVSQASRDIAADDPDLAFAPAGNHALKGVPGEWDLWSVTEAAAATVPAVGPQPTAADRVVVATARRAPKVVRAVMRLGNAVQRRRVR